MPNLGKNRQNDKYTILDRRKRVATLYCEGKAQHEIARAVGFSQQTIADDLRHIREEWLSSALQDFDQRRAQELAKLDHLEEVAWASWQRSIAPRGKGKLRVTPTGEAKFLDVVFKVVETRLKILGLLKAGNVKVVQTMNWDALVAGLPDTTTDPIEAKIAEVSPLPQRLESKPSTNGNGAHHDER